MIEKSKIESEVPLLVLQDIDFSAGHWPGVKNPPWMLSELFYVNHPDIKERAKVIKLEPGEDKKLCEATMEIDGEKEIVDVVISRPENRPQKKEKPENNKKYDSDVDRMLDEVYGYSAVENFNELLRYHPNWSLEQALKEFEKNPTGNQTNFFRTGNLEVIAEQIAPQLQKGEKRMKILDIGSATGEEAYSLGTLLLENGIQNFKIDGVDVTPKAVEIARTGEYNFYISSIGQVGNDVIESKHLKKDYIKKGYFEDTGKRWQRREFSGKYRLSDLVKMRRVGLKTPADAYIEFPQVVVGVGEKLRDKISFEEHDIIDSPVDGQYDLVVMNHVLIHYPPPMCDQILKNALSSLKPGGILVLEHTLVPRENEKEWLGPYNRWRDNITEKFPLEEVETKIWYSDEPAKTRQYYKFLGWNQKQSLKEKNPGNEIKRGLHST